MDHERKTTEMKGRKKWEKIKRLVIATLNQEPLKIRIFIHISSSDCTIILQRMVIFILKMDLSVSEGLRDTHLLSCRVRI